MTDHDLERRTTAARFCCAGLILGIVLSSPSPLRAQGLQLAALPASPVESLLDSVAAPAHRPRAIEYSDWYYRRLEIHRIASYPEIPVMAAEYVLGERLLHDEQFGRPPSGLVTAHVIVAGTLAGLFGINTITGGWNLWDSRHDPNGRPRRLIHAISMLVADAGFATAGAIGSSAKHSLSAAQLHRAVAVSSMGVSTASTIMMWVWRN